MEPGDTWDAVLPDHWPAEGVSWSVESEDGELRVNRFPGVMFWGAPFYTVAHLAGGQPEVPDHPYLLSYRPAAVAAVTATTMAVVVSFFVFRRLVDRPIAFGAALVFTVATSTWSDLRQRALDAWPDPPVPQCQPPTSRFGTADRGRRLARAQHLHPPADRHRGGLPRPGPSDPQAERGRPAAGGGPSALGLAALMAYSWVNFRNPLPTAGYDDYAVQALSEPTTATHLPRRIWGSLFHPFRGLVSQAPFLLILLPGLRQAWQAAPPWVRNAAVAGVAYQLFQLQLNDFDGGIFFFSYRLQLEMLVLAAPLLLLAFMKFVAGHRLREIAFVIGASGAVGFQLLGITTQSVEAFTGPGLEPAVEQLCEAAEYECRVEDILP
jgi:hypothetical protein